MTALAIIGQVLIVLGSVTFFTAGLGIVRFPDVYTRASAVGTAAGVGITLLVVGAFLQHPGVADLAKLIVLIAMQLAGASIGTIIIARAAYLTGVPMANPHFDDLDDSARED